MLGEFLLQTDL